jgi:exosortase/archaeosortase family protein
MNLIRNILSNKYFKAIQDVLLFILITMAIHFAWRFWSIRLEYAPVAGSMAALSDGTIGWLVVQTSWILDHIFRIPFYVDGNILWFDNKYGLSVNESCSGIKQIAQFVLLMILFPGPWKQKAWFIPLGITIVYLTNVVRLVLLGLTLDLIPAHQHVIHRYLLRAMFYVVIFFLWVWWVNRFCRKESESGADAGQQ